MTTKQTLLDLAERVEKLAAPDRVVELAICLHVFARNVGIAKYTASIDAAMTLVPEGYDWAVFRTNNGLTVHAWCGNREDIFGETPPLALTAAALRARAEMVE